MAKPKLIYALAKVIIAAAWADGEIAHDEINSLKDLLFRLPNLEARDWATLEIYTDSPIDADERARLVEELITAMATRADKKLETSLRPRKKSHRKSRPRSKMPTLALLAGLAD